MGRSRCRRGRQYGDEWQRQHGGGKLKPQFNGATISFVFLKCQKKTPIFIFFSKNLPPSEICRPRRPPIVRLMVKPPLTVHGFKSRAPSLFVIYKISLHERRLVVVEYGRDAMSMVVMESVLVFSTIHRATRPSPL
jgi:hypothetical protein